MRLSPMSGHDEVANNNINNNNNINISSETLDKANRAKEVIENYYKELVRLKQERSDRLTKINNLINQEKLSDEEKTQVKMVN